MAADPWVVYASLAEKIGNKLIDFDTDDFRMALVLDTYTPDQAADDEWADVSGSEHANANGYLTGGALLTEVDWSLAGTISTFTSTAAQWIATGGSLICRYAVIYDDTAAGKPLVAYCLLDNAPEDVTVTNGNLLKITPHASGIFSVEPVSSVPSLSYVGGPTGAIVIDNDPTPGEIDIDTAIVPRKAQSEIISGVWTFTPGFMLGAGVEPAADASVRGRVVMVQGGDGVADTLRVCLKDAADSYAWKSLVIE